MTKVISNNQSKGEGKSRREIVFKRESYDVVLLEKEKDSCVILRNI